MNDYPRRAADDPRVGTRVGDYGVDSLLGEGGMGKVYCATGLDGTGVALKIVMEDYARDPVFRRRLPREARIAQTVKHPNVVPVLDTGEQQGIPYMAQRYIEGVSLDEKLTRDGPLDVTTAVRICGSPLRLGGDSSVRKGDLDAGAAEVDHRDQRVGGVEAVSAV